MSKSDRGGCKLFDRIDKSLVEFFKKRGELTKILEWNEKILEGFQKIPRVR
jgi:hypothetical protein